MAMQWFIVIFPLLWNFANACEVNQTCDLDLNDPNIQTLLIGMENFSVNILKYGLGDDLQKNNVVFSNTSIYIVLALILFGAGGQTQTELIEALGFPKTELQQVQTSFLQILNALNIKRTSKDSNSKEIIIEEVRFAEGIFIQEGFNLVQEYSHFVTQIEEVEIQYSNFANNLQGANNQIADWIKRNNPGHDSLYVWATAAANTKILLTNVLYFSANWIPNLFHKSNTKTATFTGMFGPREIPFMRTVKELKYFDDGESVTAIQLPFAEGDFALIVMLPYANVNAVELVKNLTSEKCNTIIEEAEPMLVDCQIPKFTAISFAMKLADVLPKLNINELFKSANLSKMLANQSQERFAAEAFHAAAFSIDENGMMAVAISTGSGEAQELSSNSQSPMAFVANRPFYAAIMHVKTETVILKAFIQNLEL